MPYMRWLDYPLLLKGRIVMLSFELYKGKYRSLPELAWATGILGGYIYKVRQGKCAINQKFIIGAIKAFSGSE